MNNRINHKRISLQHRNKSMREEREKLEELKSLLLMYKEKQEQDTKYHTRKIDTIDTSMKNIINKTEGELEKIKSNLNTMHIKSDKTTKKLINDMNKMDIKHSNNFSLIEKDVVSRIEKIEMDNVMKDDICYTHTYSEKNTSTGIKDLYLCREDIERDRNGIWVMRVDWVYNMATKKKIYSGVVHVLWKKEKDEDPTIYDYEIYYHNEEIDRIEFCIVKDGLKYMMGIKIRDTNVEDVVFSQYSFAPLSI